MLEECLCYLCELEECCGVIFVSIEEQGKLIFELVCDIKFVDIKICFEDFYLFYKQKCCIKGQIVLEVGFGVLVDVLFDNLILVLESEVVCFVDVEKGFVDVKVVLEGVKYIFMECFVEDVMLFDKLCVFMKNEVILIVCVVFGKEQEGVKFSDYFEYDELLKSVLLYCVLVIFCGCNEGVFSVLLKVGEEVLGILYLCEVMIVECFGLFNQGCVVDKWLVEVVCWIWKVKFYIYLEIDLFGEFCDGVEDEVISVFVCNLYDLLLVVLVGLCVIFGFDLGLCIGVKVVVVDVIGKLLDIVIVYLYVLKNQWDQIFVVFVVLCVKYQVELIVIGNGIVSCEIDKLVGELIKKYLGMKLIKIMVSEVGVLVYFVFELVVKEFFELDVFLCGVVFIVCCLQDLLVELVKIEFKLIGVGQYQYDVFQLKLVCSLDVVVEDCVNVVGVDVNIVFVVLLVCIFGFNLMLVQNIVVYCDVNGVFCICDELKKVSCLGEKIFE